MTSRKDDSDETASVLTDADYAEMSKSYERFPPRSDEVSGTVEVRPPHTT